MVRLLNCLLIVLMLSPFGTAQAQSLLGPSVTTATSGKGPTTDNFIKDPSTGMTLKSIEFGEQGDDPCYFKMTYRHVRTGAESSQTYNRCDGKSPGDIRRIELPDIARVTAARICLNSAGDKIKGVQLIGGYQDCVLGAKTVTVQPNECSPVHKYSGVDYRLCSTGAPGQGVGPVTLSCTIPITRYWERTNCPGSRGEGPDDSWAKVVSCGPRTVATGVKLRTIAGGGKRKMANGLALVCSRIDG